MVGISLLTLVPGELGGSETYTRELLRGLARVRRERVPRAGSPPSRPTRARGYRRPSQSSTGGRGRSRSGSSRWRPRPPGRGSSGHACAKPTSSTFRSRSGSHPGRNRRSHAARRPATSTCLISSAALSDCSAPSRGTAQCGMRRGLPALSGPSLAAQEPQAAVRGLQAASPRPTGAPPRADRRRTYT